jgi:hypothetical protein
MPPELKHPQLLAIQKALFAVAEAIPLEPQAATRDWSGFLAALATFVENVLPLILPLFSKMAGKGK